MRASSAVPAVFQPVSIGTREYVDGGLVGAGAGAHHARQMGAEFVIAVDISAAPEGNPTGDAARMLLQTFAIMGKQHQRATSCATPTSCCSPRLAGVSARRLHDPRDRSRPGAT